MSVSCGPCFPSPEGSNVLDADNTNASMPRYTTLEMSAKIVHPGRRFDPAVRQVRPAEKDESQGAAPETAATAMATLASAVLQLTCRASTGACSSAGSGRLLLVGDAALMLVEAPS